MIYEATKKPVTVQAFHYTDPIQINEISEWIGDKFVLEPHLNFLTLLGEDLDRNKTIWIMDILISDWIIKTPEGKVSKSYDLAFTSLYDYKLWEAE